MDLNELAGCSGFVVTAPKPNSDAVEGGITFRVEGCVQWQTRDGVMRRHSCLLDVTIPGSVANSSHDCISTSGSVLVSGRPRLSERRSGDCVIEVVAVRVQYVESSFQPGDEEDDEDPRDQPSTADDPAPIGRPFDDLPF